MSGPSPKVETVADGVWRVEARLNGVFVSIYILKGEGVAVVDTGYRFHPNQVIVPGLRQLGIAANDVDLILNTHGHPDHLGGNAALQRWSGAAIAVPVDDLYLASGADAHIGSRTDHIMAMRLLGWTDQVAARERFLRERVEACDVDRALTDGDVVDLGKGLRLTVVRTPGHSAGSVAFFCELRGIAIVGDAVQGWGVSAGILPLYYEPREYSASLARIAGLRPGTLCMGHGFLWSQAPVGASPVRRGGDVARTLDDSLIFVARLSDAVAAERSPRPLPDQVAAVARRLQPAFATEADRDGRIPAASAATIIAHLHQDGHAGLSDSPVHDGGGEMSP